MKKILVSLVAAGLLAGVPAMAKTSKEVTNDAVTAAKSDAGKQQHTEVVKEAVQAVALTHDVIAALDRNDTKSAKASLEKAIGKLEVVLAAPNAPAMLPIDGTIRSVEYLGTAKDVKAQVKAVEELLDDGKVQEARALLSTLQSEIDIVTVSLPLISYPNALKLAAKYLNESKVQEAKEVLLMALGTFAQSQIVIPVPLLKAQALIEEASAVAKKDKAAALGHLSAAREQLKLAKALGYVSGSDTTYKMLDDSIEKIEKEIKGKNRAEKLFDDLIAKLREFKEKAVSSESTK